MPYVYWDGSTQTPLGDKDEVSKRYRVLNSFQASVCAMQREAEALETISGMCRVQLARTLQAIAGLCFLADHIQHRVDELSALSVVTLGPVVSRSSL